MDLDVEEVVHSITLGNRRCVVSVDESAKVALTDADDRWATADVFGRINAIAKRKNICKD